MPKMSVRLFDSGLQLFPSAKPASSQNRPRHNPQKRSDTSSAAKSLSRPPRLTRTASFAFNLRRRGGVRCSRLPSSSSSSWWRQRAPSSGSVRRSRSAAVSTRHSRHRGTPGRTGDRWCSRRRPRTTARRAASSSGRAATGSCHRTILVSDIGGCVVAVTVGFTRWTVRWWFGC